MHSVTSAGELQDLNNLSNENNNDSNFTNLIINYLPSTLTDDGLKELFQAFGKITSHRVIYNKQVGASMGYGFVRFEHKENAAQAIKIMNGLKIDNKRLKVALALPSKKPKEPSNVYLAGIPLSYTKTELDQLMTPFGIVTKSLILIDKNTGLSRGAAFCLMDTRKEALDAITGLNGTMVEGGTKKLVVKFADEQTPGVKKKRPLPDIGFRNGNSGYGPVTLPRPNAFNPRYNPIGQGHHIPQHYHSQYPNPGQYHNPGQYPTTNSQGTSHSQFHHIPHSAASLLPHTGSNSKALLGSTPHQEQTPNQDQEIDQHHRQPSLSNTSREGVPLFVYHIPQGCTETDLYDIFSMYGEIHSIKIIRNLQTGENKGYGFVNMADMGQAQEAIKNLNGYQMGHKYLQVKLKT